jgi:hypothetical protein
VPVNSTLTINKATLTVTASSAVKLYDGQTASGLAVSISGFVNNETSSVVTGTPSLTGAAVKATNAGTYPVTPDISGLSANNYNFTTVNGSLVINKVQVTVTADPFTKPYDAKTTSGFSSKFAGFVNGENESVVTGTINYTGTAPTAVAVGTAAIVPDVSALTATNYTFASANGTLTINKAVLTVTPNPFVKTYDAISMGTTTSTRAFQKSTATVINGPGGDCGIATDGTNIFISDSQNIKTISYAGSLLATNAVANLGGPQHSIAYAKGFLFARNGSSLYRVSTTTWASTLVSVDPSYPLLTASGYLLYTLFDTPSGQLGVMGAAPNPVVRFYNVSSDGLNLTFARSVTLNVVVKEGHIISFCNQRRDTIEQINYCLHKTGIV